MVGHSMSSLALFGDVGAASLKEQETSRTLGRENILGNLFNSTDMGNSSSS